MGTIASDGAPASSSSLPESMGDPSVLCGSVLITGVGGIVGQAVLKSLADTPYRLIGADASEQAAGIYAATRGYLVPKVKDPDYVDRLLAICASERVAYLFAGLDVELPLFARAAARFRTAGVLPILSSPALVEMADDKLDTARFLDSHGFPAPRTRDLAEGIPRDLEYPFVLKPRKGGSRSQGVHTVTSENDLRFRMPSIDAANYVAQEHIDGDEFTCGTINFDGRCHGVIVMRRTLRDGDTHKAFVVRDSVIESHVRSVAETLKPFGPCNFQLRMRGGTPYIFDINPRCSGTTYCRALAGFNEPLMTLNYLEHGLLPSFEIRPISIFRYWKELVVDNPEVEQARRAGMVRDSGRRL